MKADPIRHVIVLMLENRSFDHFLGAMPGVDGVDAESPRSNKLSPQSSMVFAQHDSPEDRFRFDPGHGHASVVRQVEGGGLGSMGGFVYDYSLAHPKEEASWGQVMSYYAWGRLPCLHELAAKFCVCDRWFSSVPGPTWANRFFALSGTSQGWVEMPHLPIDWNLHTYDQTTIFDRLNDKGVEWRVYHGDIPQSLLLRNQRRPENRARYRLMRHFRDDVSAAGNETFPAFTFIEPHYFWPGRTDQHPPNNVMAGDALVGNVYNALRANDEVWNSTLLVVTYDEHGGFYDHVRPPNAARPDELARESCSFDKAGVRVPAILVSKWVSNSVYRSPDEKLLDHTSVLRYLQDKYELGGLGGRAAAAGSIASAISNIALEDTPQSVGGARPRAFEFGGEEEADHELNENQRGLLDFAESLGVSTPDLEVGALTRELRGTTEGVDRVEAAKRKVVRYIEEARSYDLNR
jgi:phospholipase C